MTFDHDLKKNYTTSITRYVGHTAVSGVRGTLPQPAPTDLNAIWLAPNGNDGNAGTAAAPKLTLNGAILALTAGKPTVHIFRNSYVGDLDFTEGTTRTLPASRNIQVEEGEFATLEFTGGTRLNMSGTGKINGLLIKGNFNHISSGVVNGGDTDIIQNCTLINESTDSTTGAFAVRGAGMSYCTVHNLASTPAYFMFATLTQPTVENCILHYGQATDWLGLGSTDNFPDYVRTLFLHKVISQVDSSLPTVSSINVSFSSCVFFGTYLFETLDTLSDVTPTFDYCQNNTIATVSPTLPKVSVSSPTETNAVDSSLPGLYVDYATGIVDFDPQKFRLQAEGKLTPDGSGRYFINSPLIGAGLAGVDVNPWDETTTFTSYAFNDTTELKYEPKTGTRNSNLINAAKLNTTKGDLHRAFDARRRVWNFNYGENFMSNDIGWSLEKLIADTGTMLWNRLSAGESEYEQPTAIFDAVNNTLTPNAPSKPLVSGHWAGFVAEFDGKRYLITSNDTAAWTLQDLFQVGFPASGNYNVIILAGLVKIDQANSSISQVGYNPRDGGTESEIEPLECRLEYKNGSLTTHEVRILSENRGLDKV